MEGTTSWILCPVSSIVPHSCPCADIQHIGLPWYLEHWMTRLLFRDNSATLRIFRARWLTAPSLAVNSYHIHLMRTSLGKSSLFKIRTAYWRLFSEAWNALPYCWKQTLSFPECLCHWISPRFGTEITALTLPRKGNAVTLKQPQRSLNACVAQQRSSLWTHNQHNRVRPFTPNYTFWGPQILNNLLLWIHIYTFHP